MGFRFRKSTNIGPFRITASKSGISTSFGGKGARVTKMANGRTRTTLSIPGTGISHVSETGKTKAPAKVKKKNTSAVAAPTPTTSDAPLLPMTVRAIGLFIIALGLLLLMFAWPLGLLVIGYGIYRIVKAKEIADRHNEKMRQTAIEDQK